MTFALGGAQNGFSFQIGAQGARGLVNGEETTYSNTHIRVGDAEHPGTLNITSGGDTTLQGATASANTISTDIGGNLLIESLKDKIKYDSQQTNVGGGVSICIPPICYGQIIAVTVNAAQSKIKADHDSVGAEVSPTLISSITDAVNDEIKLWQSRPLDPCYAIVYLDCLMLKIRDSGSVSSRAVYLAVGVNLDGMKEVLGIWTAQTEGAKFWLAVITELMARGQPQNRGVADILIACVDGLKGFPEAIEAVFPHTEV